jgi:tetratricopeptide (TPR) repeat protein
MLVCLAAAGSYTASVARHYVAYRLSTNADPVSLDRAAGLEPWNADWRWESGRYALFVSQDPAVAVSKLQAAVALNPHLARYWLDLAAAYQLSGDLDQRRSAIERALKMEPSDPNVAWEVANFYLTQNDLDHALQLFRVVIANDPKQTSSALRLCWHATKSVDLMRAKVLPSEIPPYFTFLGLLVAENETAPAGAVWRALLNLGKQFPTSDAFPYFDYLLQQQQTEAAVQVWSQLVKRSAKLQSYTTPGNLVVDGSLEKGFLNGGFDWRYSITGPVQLSIDSAKFHSGNQALRMLFKGPPVSDTGIFEYIPAHPSSDYHFNVYTKSEDIESASGPRIAVLDAYSGQTYVLTDDSLGTTGWRPQSADFRTGPETSLLVVTVRRVPGTPLIKGKFWIDDVSLVQRGDEAALTDAGGRSALNGGPLP